MDVWKRGWQMSIKSYKTQPCGHISSVLTLQFLLSQTVQIPTTVLWQSYDS